MDRFNCNKLNSGNQSLHIHKYYAPLTSQVEALEPPNKSKGEKTALYVNIHISSPAPKFKPTHPPNHKMYFILPAGHIEKDSTEWRRIPRSQSRDKQTAPTARTHLKLSQWQCRRHEDKIDVYPKISAPTEAHINQRVIDGTISSAAWDIACTSNSGKVGDPYIQTDHISTKVVSVVDGHRTPASTVAKLHHPVREPPRTVDMVLDLADQFLLRSRKFSEVGYISIRNGKEVNIYDGRTAQIEVS